MSPYHIWQQNYVWITTVGSSSKHFATMTTWLHLLGEPLGYLGLNLDAIGNIEEKNSKKIWK